MLICRKLYIGNIEEAGFVDYKNYDFNLREDSIVWKHNPNFIKLPFDRMGRTEDIKVAD